MVLPSKNKAPYQIGDCEVFNGNPFMTFQVVIEEDLVFVAAFNHEEVMRRFPLDDDDARNDKVLAHRVAADRQHLE